MQIIDLHPLVVYIRQYLFISCLQATILTIKDYTNGLSLISLAYVGIVLVFYLFS